MTSILKGLWVWFQMEAFRLGGDLHWLKPSCTYPLLPFEVTSSLSAKILLVSHLAGPQRSKGLTWLPQHSHSHSLNTAEFPVPILRFPVPSKTHPHSVNSDCLQLIVSIIFSIIAVQQSTGNIERRLRLQIDTTMKPTMEFMRVKDEPDDPDARFTALATMRDTRVLASASRIKHEPQAGMQASPTDYCCAC